MFSLLLLLTACNVHQGNGIPAMEVRQVGPFHAVEASSSVDVEVSSGTSSQGSDLVQAPDAGDVRVYCDRNLLGDIVTVVEQGSLHIRVLRGVSLQPRTACRVEADSPELFAVHSSGSGDLVARGPALEWVTSSGSGDVVVSALDSARLEVTGSGSGDLDLSGAAGTLDLNTSGSGDVHGRDLRCLDASVRTTGSGDVKLTVTGSLEVRSSGSGDVTIWGNPRVDHRSSTGSGEISVH
jgi:hypothetical protein